MSRLLGGWEVSELKHIFVLSSSGKPIFSRYGDEQELATTFGLLQAVISIAQDSGDSIRCIRAGQRTIVYFFAQAMYFISISSTGEPEAVLVKQLHFMYQQILLVLTSKIHSVFKTNPSVDIRQLLGPDTFRLMRAACKEELAPVNVVFEALDTVVMHQRLRSTVIEHLRHCVEQSGAALGMLIWEDKLVGIYGNSNTELALGTADLLLLAHFVINSGSLRANDQYWVPICMPDFNANGYLQAYVSGFSVAEANSSASQQKQSTEMTTQVTLIMVASSADPDVFKELMSGKKYLEEAIQDASIADKLLISLQSLQSVTIDRFLESSRSLHFLFKIRPVARKAARSFLMPTQFIQSAMRFPLDQKSTHESIWIAYEFLAVRVRRGSCTLESTFFPDDHNNSNSSNNNNTLDASSPPSPLSPQHTPFAKRADADDTLSYFSKNSNMKPGSSSRSNSGFDSAAVSNRAGNVKSAAPTAESADAVQESAVSLLSSLPSSDHALAYTVLSSGMVVVALATYESELYVTFPPNMSPMDACSTADLLSRNLKADSANLFQTASSF